MVPFQFHRRKKKDRNRFFFKIILYRQKKEYRKNNKFELHRHENKKMYRRNPKKTYCTAALVFLYRGKINIRKHIYFLFYNWVALDYENSVYR